LERWRGSQIWGSIRRPGRIPQPELFFQILQLGALVWIPRIS
jgi:hypothetical protein